jgi:DNA-binding transcriptional LysR family regulator
MERRSPKPAAQPDLVDLRAFCLVVDFGSLTEAAQVLQETKGSVSRRLSRLEELLGVSLLQRSPRLVKATEEGRLYRQRLAQALQLLDSANAAVQQTLEEPKGHLRLTAPHDLGLELLAPLVADFIGRYPEITVEVLLTSQLLDFDEQQIDFAFRATSTLRDSSLIAHKIMDIKGAFVASPAYLITSSAPQKPSALSSHRVLLNRNVSSTILLQHIISKETTDLSLGQATLTAEMSFLARAAAAGAGIALLPLDIIERELRDGSLLRILPDYEAPEMGKLYLLYRSWQYLPPKIRAFRDFALERLAQECDKRK